MPRSTNDRSPVPPPALPIVCALAAFAAFAALAAVAAGCDSSPACGAGGVPGAGGAASGAGGGGGGGGAPGVAALGCGDPEPGVLDYLDDMEDGDSIILYRGGRIGSWYTYHDMTTGSLTPDQGTTVTMEPIPGGRCGTSKHAMRVTGSGFSDWGAGFGFDLHYGAGPTGMSMQLPYDVSAYKGITFWARVGEMSINTIRVGIGDQWSRPDGGHCSLATISGPTACYDTLGASVPLTTSWQRFVLSFDHLQQRAFGFPEPNGLDTTTVMDLEFNIPMSSPVFDVWVDDVALFK